MSVVAAERLTLDQFYREYEGRRAYLIDGVPHLIPPPNPPHSTSVEWLAEELRKVVPPGCYVRQENPLETGGANDPEPDLAVLRGSFTDFREHHPTAADALLVVEVADSSASTDRGRKLPKYAAAGIAEVWLVDLNASVLEVYRDPRGQRYGSSKTFRRGERVTTAFGGSVLVDDWVGN